MNFKRAITTASKFTGKSGITERIRGIPRSGVFPARVYATDGQVAVLCDLDEGLDIPNATFDAKLLSKIAREGNIGAMDMVEYGTVLVKVGASTYRLEDCAKPHNSASHFPGFPVLPENWNAETQWDLVSRTLHAVSKDEDEPQLMCVNFHADGWVEASDKNRVVRVRQDPGATKSGMVPLRLFKNLPKREIFSCFSQSEAFFRIGLDELRFAALQRGVFPDVKKYVPEQHHGHEAIVETKDFKLACKRASALSPIHFVSLEFQRGKIIIKAWNEHPQTFEVVLVADNSHESSIIISGQMLDDALDEVVTPAVSLGYTRPTEPLRIEGPNDYVELIWPQTLE